MAVEHVTKAMIIDDLVVPVTAWRFVCDYCGTRETFPDVPMPEGRSEMDASRRGWKIMYVDDEMCRCPTCVARS